MEGICFLCGNYEPLERHHIFGGARRPISEKYGLTVDLCPWCHRIDADSAHRCRETRLFLQQYGQRRAMKEQGWTVQEFIERLGRNYLDEEENDTSSALRAPSPQGEGMGKERRSAAPSPHGEGFKVLEVPEALMAFGY